jgi:hypothetical protein
MLPAIFRIDDPMMQVAYATDERIKLETIIDALENQIFIADDALGWVYQFWQTDEKKRINDSGDKIDGEKLPAVTQLFTEPYMVHFLIDNTLGAWWVSRNPGVKPPVKFEYLRLLEDGTPAAGKFEGWPTTTADVTSLDPCMGSGHFVASLFPVFAAFRMHEEGLTKEQATDKVIAENLHGLELDARCTQIAAFNLALTAWKFCGHYKVLPEMNLACSGIAPKGKVEDWVKLVGNVPRDDKGRMENGMKVLYEHFQLAPELGSLLDPTTIKADIYTASFEELQPVLKKALENEADTEQLERGVMAAGIAKAGQLLAKKCTLLITNVPYLARGKQGDLLQDFIHANYSESERDLATAFLQRMRSLSLHGGTLSLVMPQNWLAQISYKKLRDQIVKQQTIPMICRLGKGAFETISGEVVNVILYLQHNRKPSLKENTSLIDLDRFQNKTIQILKEKILLIPQSNFQKTKDNIISFSENESGTQLLNQFAFSFQGIKSGDDNSYCSFFWEHDSIDGLEWKFEQSTSTISKEFSGRYKVIRWGKRNELARLQGQAGWNKLGVMVNQMSSLSATLFNGNLFDGTVSAVIPRNTQYLAAIFAFCSSPYYSKEVRKVENGIAVSNAILTQVPFDLAHWQKVAAEKYPNGLPKPYSDDTNQWLFHGHPIKTENPLQVALARVLGYRWPAQSYKEMELAALIDLELQAVHGFLRMRYDVGLLNFSSRPRDVLPEEFAQNYSSNCWRHALLEGRRRYMP